MRTGTVAVVAIVGLLGLLWPSLLQAHPPIICRDPDLGGTAQNADRKFLIFGTDSVSLAGIGNLLVFFPAAFYFAALTGRDLLISDHSIVGEMCNIIHCGFPFVSEIATAFPKILTQDAIANSEILKVGDFMNYMEGQREVKDKVVRATGYQIRSDWWVWFNYTVPCVSKITGCDIGDVMCAERHAYQRLIRGPFKTAFTTKEEERIQGVPAYFKHALLTLPHAYSPRLDFAVHLRAQFYHFEQQTNVDDPEYKKEVSEWLASEECQSYFSAMKDHLADQVTQLRSTKEAGEPVYIYLAADNEDVKEAFLRLVRNTTSLNSAEEVCIMRVDAQSIYHVKNLPNFKKLTNDEGLLDMVFDWYALSLANVIYAWRKGGTNMISSFVQSAQKLSGTIERTNIGENKGIGSKGYQLIRDRRGRIRFDMFWSYGFLPDHSIPQKR